MLLGFENFKLENFFFFESNLNFFLKKRFFDYDGSGYVSSQSLRRVLTTLGDPLTDQEIDDMVRDAGGDPINYQQFVVTLLTKTT